jgi:hypothetical protein
MDRQQILLGLLVVVGIGLGGDWAYRTWVEEPFRKQEAEQAKQEKAQADVHDRTIKAKTLVRDLIQFEDRSLPANPTIARQAYQAWWWQLLKSYPIANPTVDISQPRPRSLTKTSKKDAQSDFHEFSVTVRGVAALEIVIDLLADFHDTPFLHRIDGLNLTPINQGRSLSFVITASAISLRTATQTEQLPGQSPGTLILAADPTPGESPANLPADETTGQVPPSAADADPLTLTRPRAALPVTTAPDPSAAAAARPSPPQAPPSTDPAILLANDPPVTTALSNDETPGQESERPWQEIVKRNMFAAGGGMTVAKTLKLSAITEDAQGVRQAWFRLTQAGSTQIIDQGKTLSQGPLAAEVIEVGEEHAVLLIDGDRVRVQIGQVIADGVALVPGKVSR